MLQWVAMPASRASSRPRDGTRISYVSCFGRRVLYHQRHLQDLIRHVLFLFPWDRPPCHFTPGGYPAAEGVFNWQVYFSAALCSELNKEEEKDGFGYHICNVRGQLVTPCLALFVSLPVPPQPRSLGSADVASTLPHKARCSSVSEASLSRPLLKRAQTGKAQGACSCSLPFLPQPVVSPRRLLFCGPPLPRGSSAHRQFIWPMCHSLLSSATAHPMFCPPSSTSEMQLIWESLLLSAWNFP